MTIAAVEHGASFARVLTALEDAGCAVQRTGTWQASAQCPAHEDRSPSLSVTWRDGKTLLHCHAGCTDAGSSNDPSPVLQELGLGLGDLFDAPRPQRDPGRPGRRPSGPRQRGARAERPKGRQQRAAAKPDKLGRPTGQWQVVAEYVYTDENGEPLGLVIREQQNHEHGYAKRFWQRHWTGQCTRAPCDERRRGRTITHAERWGKDAPRRRVLYNLPAVLAAVAAGQEVWLVEGEKDADALNAHFQAAGMAAVATTYASGAGSWRDEYGSALAGAVVVIVEDNDPQATHPVTGKPREPAGRLRSRKLLAALDGTAASVRVVRARAGKDSFDHLAAGHGAAEFLPVQIPPAEDQPPGRARLQVVRDGGGDGPGGGAVDGDEPNRRVRYEVRHGELVKVATDRYGATRYDVVLGCHAQITRIDQKVTTGDEPQTTTGYLIRVEHPDRPGEPCEIRVPRKAWDSGEWLHDLPWAGVTFDSSRSGLARVRDAIRMTSRSADVAVVHGAPGWVRGADDAWMYIHAGGALGAAGPVAAETDLPSKLAQFILPAPPADAAALRAAAAHSAGLVTTLPRRIGAVLAGLAFRAAISRMPPSVTLIGPPGSYKTSMAKVTLHHFAPDLPWDESVLSLSERGATGNAAAKLMHLTRDTLLVADDAAPDRSLKAAAERVASLVRLQYNGETRDRLDREAELQRPTPPRGSLLISAEVGPSAASASQRTLIVPFHPGDISRDVRLAVWEPESRHARAAAAASFISWIAGRRDEVLEHLAGLAAGYADTWHQAGYDERTAEALAHLAAGWRLMLDHLTERGAYTPAEADQLWQQAWDGLGEAGRMQHDPDEPADPAGRILARLRTGLLGRFGHLTDDLGMPPPAGEAQRYGWAVEPGPSRPGLAEPPSLQVRSGGDFVGCYSDETGERRLWLVPDLTLMMLRRVADRLGEPCEETTSSVGEWLRQSGVGLVTTYEKSTGRLRRSRQQTMPGKGRPWIWDIPESALYDDPGTGEADDPVPDPDPADGAGPGNVSGPGHDEPHHDPGRQPGGEDLMTTGAAPGHRWPGLISYPQLLDLAARDHVCGWGPAQLRSRYCTVTFTSAAAAQPCAGCGDPCTVLVGQVPLHLACPDPPPGWQPSPPATPTSPPPGPVPAGPAGARSAPPPAPGRGRAGATAQRRWRAAAAVLDASSLYLPGGEVEPLPAGLAHAGDLGDLPQQLDLGWGGGKLPPATGQLWLTAAFLDRAGLPVPPAGQLAEDRDHMLEEAATLPFISAAIAGGWQISEASRARLGHRMRVWRDANRAGAQLVFVPYIAGEVHLLDGDPDPAALAARLDLFARTAEVPYGRSAAYSGHDLLARLDARRHIVVTGPADPPPARPSSSGLISFQRGPTKDEARCRYVHSYDTTAAWLAAAAGAELGTGTAVHSDAPRFDPAVPGLWRVAAPRWDSWAIPNPFTGRRPRDDGTAWLSTPLLALAVDLLGAEMAPIEAWTWPEHTRYLNLWATELNKARLALAELTAAGDPDAGPVLAAVKDTYSGAITLFGSAQLDEDQDTGRARDKFFRPDWAHLVVATATARLYRKILQVEAACEGRWPLAIDRDNLLYASDDPDPERACPAPLRYSNQLGGVKCKGSAQLGDVAAQLAAGRFSFDRLTRPAAWDPGGGGPAPDST